MFTVSVNASQHLAFIALGIRNESATLADYQKFLETWDRGEAELIAACQQASIAIASVADRLQREVTPAPRGLVEYDVSEKFGAYLAKQIATRGEFPDEEGQRLALLALFGDYLAKGEDATGGPLVTVLFILKGAIPNVQ